MSLQVCRWCGAGVQAGWEADCPDRPWWDRVWDLPGWVRERVLDWAVKRATARDVALAVRRARWGRESVVALRDEVERVLEVER